jgi:hypothetical protein
MGEASKPSIPVVGVIVITPAGAYATVTRFSRTRQTLSLERQNGSGRATLRTTVHLAIEEAPSMTAHRVRFASHLLAVSIIALGGCGYYPLAQPPPPAESPPVANRGTLVMYTGILDGAERPDVDCEAQVAKQSDALAAAADKALHDSPRPGMRVPPPSVLFGKLRAEHVAFSLELGPGGAPVVKDSISLGREQWRVPPQSAKEQTDYSAFRAKDARVGWVVDELRLQIDGFARAFASAHWGGQSGRVLAYTMATFLREMRDDAMPDDLVARARRDVRKSLSCVKRGTSLEAAATGVFAAYQAGASGDHPEVADKAIVALAGVLPVKDEASDADVDAQLALIDKQIQEAYEKAVGAPAGRAPATGGSSVAAASQAADGDGTAMLPKGSRERQVVDGAQAAMKGDYKSALRDVAPYAPGPLGAVLTLAAGLFGG